MKLDPYLSPCAKSTLNGSRPQRETENTGVIDTYWKEYMNRALFAQELRLRIDKWPLVRSESFYTSKETVNWVKRKTAEWGSLPVVFLTDYYPEHRKNSRSNESREQMAQ